MVMQFAMAGRLKNIPVVSHGTGSLILMHLPWHKLHKLLHPESYHPPGPSAMGRIK